MSKAKPGMQPIYIEVADEPVNVREFSGKEGKQVRLIEQKIYIHEGARYPTPVSILVASEEDKYPPGTYAFGPGSIKANQYGSPELSRDLVLVPIPDPAAVRAKVA